MTLKGIHNETEFERKLSDSIRELCVRQIEILGREESCRRLQLLDCGLTHFLWRRHWSIEHALRAADVLGLGVCQTLLKVAEKRL